jgi:uncharacterized protein YktA (UPF0223 family)
MEYLQMAIKTYSIYFDLPQYNKYYKIYEVDATDMIDAFKKFKKIYPHAKRELHDIVLEREVSKKISWKMIVIEVALILSVFAAGFIFIVKHSEYKAVKILEQTHHTQIIKNEDVHCSNDYLWSYSFTALSGFNLSVKGVVCTNIWSGHAVIIYRD